MLHKRTLIKLFLIPVDKVHQLFYLSKRDLVYYCYYAGIILAYIGSLDPWFMWRFYMIYPMVAFLPIFMSMLMSFHLKTPVFTRKDFMSSFSLTFSFSSTFLLRSYIESLSASPVMSSGTRRRFVST